LRERFHRLKLQALRKIIDSLAVGPIGRKNAPVKIGQRRIAEMNVKGSDLAGGINGRLIGGRALLSITGRAE
jgi:hypothetical protein